MQRIDGTQKGNFLSSIKMACGFFSEERRKDMILFPSRGISSKPRKG